MVVGILDSNVSFKFYPPCVFRNKTRVRFSLRSFRVGNLIRKVVDVNSIGMSLYYFYILLMIILGVPR